MMKLLLVKYVLIFAVIYADAETECYTANGVDYQGVQSHVESPLNPRSNFTPCVNWNETGIPEFEGLPENYCRNSNNSVFPWCFIRAGDRLQFHLCDIPSCKTPAYQGCYKTSTIGNETLMNGNHSMLNDPKMKISRCLNFCRSRKYTYAGLKAGHSCICSKWATPEDADSILGSDGNKLPELQCKMHCANDRLHSCGGENAISVYDTTAGMCGNKYLNNKQGTIYSPRWPSRYAHNLTCAWKIFLTQPYARSSDYQIRFSFVYFDLEPENDVLGIYTFESFFDRQADHIASFHGSTHPRDVIVPLDSVKFIFVRFTSDPQLAKYGFTLNYKVEETPRAVPTESTESASETSTVRVMATLPPEYTIQVARTVPVEQTDQVEPAIVANQTYGVGTKESNLPADGPATKRTEDHTIAVIFIGIAIGVVISSMVGVVLVTGVLKRRNKKAKEARAMKPPPEFSNPVSFSNEAKTVTGV